MKAERQKEPEQGGGSNRKVGDGEGGSLKAGRGPKFPTERRIPNQGLGQEASLLEPPWGRQ